MTYRSRVMQYSVEVIQAKRCLHLGHCLARDLSCLFSAATKNAHDLAAICGEVLPALSNGGKKRLQMLVQAAFQYTVCKSAVPVLCLQFVECVSVWFKRVKEGKDYIPFHLPWVVYPQMIGIGVHAVDRFFNFVITGTKRY